MEYIALHQWMEIFHKGTLEEIYIDMGDTKLDDFSFYELGKRVNVEQQLVIRE